VVDEVDAARAGVRDGAYSAVLAIERAAGGELEFTLYTNDPATSKTAGLLQQGANAIAIGDRLDDLGVAPADQARCSARHVRRQWPTPSTTHP
jgi:hypothetical protein